MKRLPIKYTVEDVSATPAVLKETMALENPLHINVRAAKDSLSSLLERAAQGLETIITSDGRPKARLVPVERRRRPFQADRELLRSIPMRQGPRSEELIRGERDAGY